jgi:tartrate dehydratase alpha subunit/fumarate hydratase class I-like protein
VFWKREYNLLSLGNVKLKFLLNVTEMLTTGFRRRATDVTRYASKLQRKLEEREEYAPVTCPVLSISVVMKNPN